MTSSCDLGKLTVPQLKALCKERQITGYSKLSKALLLQKLAEVSVPVPLDESASTAKAPALPKAPTNTRETSTKRLAHTDTSVPSKRTKTSLKPATEATHEPRVPTSTLQQQQSTVDASVFKVPELPARKAVEVALPSSPVVSSIPHPERHEGNVGQGTEPTVTSTSTLQQNRVVASTRAIPAKRPAHIDTSVSSKRPRTSTDAGHGHEPLAPNPTPKVPLLSKSILPPPSVREASTKSLAHIDTSAPIRTPLKPTHDLRVQTSAHQQKSLVDSSVFKVPGHPAQPQRSDHHGSTLAKQPPAGINSSVVSRQIIGVGRFKPLMSSMPKSMEPIMQPSQAPVVSVTTRGLDAALDANFHATPLPILSHISFPPRASERKWVCQWAIILSALSPEDRQTCTLVSRTFRYAVYLSATHILWRNYAGLRLDTLLKMHPKNMTNFWPYLRFRRAEVSKRRDAFKQSFLGRFTDALGLDPLSAHLWTSPDDEKQVDIALRFVLTRMWFAISIGAYGHDASAWSKSTIQTVREVVKGEIWHVVTRHVGTGEMCIFYVLEATCEVIGQPPSAQSKGENESALGYRLRADWTAWISQRSRALLDTGHCSLLERLKWSNTEDYHRGISKAWLCRVQQRQDADIIAKRSVAERYILASVVANGISGQWMSTNAMAQEFAGLSCAKGALDSRTAGRSMDAVNMYLAAHHHIESVHFTTSNGEALHTAVAVVQTPGREYYVLRDNGMQVGCEEEGIPEVWQQILGCDMLGRACSLKLS